MDETPGQAGPPAGAPVPSPPPQGWSLRQAPPPPTGWGQGWNAVAPTQSKRPLWDSISLGLGGGALYFGLGGLLCAGLGMLLYKAPIASTQTGVNGTISRAIGHFILDLLALGFAMCGVAGGAVGGIAGVAGLITRRAAFALLSVVGVAVSIGSLAAGWWLLVQISSGHGF